MSLFIEYMDAYSRLDVHTVHRQANSWKLDIAHYLACLH